MPNLHKPHTMKSYDNELQQIENNLIKMMVISIEMMEFAIITFQDNDKKHHLTSVERDKEVNNLQIKIEDAVTNFIALRNPVGQDLRLSLSAINLAQRLEFISDLCKSTIKTTVKHNFGTNLPKVVMDQISHMATLSLKMLKLALQVLSTGTSVTLTEEIIASDGKVNDIYRNIFELAQKNPTLSPEYSLTEYLLDVVFVAKNFEKAADYTTEIAMLLRYIMTGSHTHSH